MHTHALNQITEIQDECREVGKKAALDILAANFPTKSKSWLTRHMPFILALSPDDLVRLIGYPDPTGEKAVRNVLAQQAEEVAA